jgi:hypothetical protein
MQNDFKLLGDSAFQSQGSLSSRMMTPLKETSLNKLSGDELKNALVRNKLISSLRQAAEWGMGSLQSKFGRLRLPLSVCPKERRILLEVVVWMYNLRVRKVRFTQIRTVFLNDYEDRVQIFYEK